MRVRVMKFGGTSVATPEARALAALKVVSAKEQGDQPVVVVSAMGRSGAPYATDTLAALLHDMDPVVEPNERELDMLIACGEIVSAIVFAHALKVLGHPAESFRGGQAGIRTDGNYGNARILGILPVAIKKSMERGRIPVVCGFQGVWVDGGLPGAELTTLGRGGSDTTAAAMGAALGADAVEIYTDVEGVKTADPEFVPDAPTLARVTYDEIAEIAHQGAKVLHPRAAEIAMRFGIPLWVKSVFTDAAGTEVVPRQELQDRRATGVTHSGRLVLFEILLDHVPSDHRNAFESTVYDLLAKHGISLYMIHHSREGIGFAVKREDFPLLERVLDGLVMPIRGDAPAVYMFQIGEQPTQTAETQAYLLKELAEPTPIRARVTEGCTMVSLVGQNYMQQPGVFLHVLQTLAEANVPVLQTADGDASLSCLIPESELRRAVATIHEEFRLGDLR